MREQQQLTSSSSSSSSGRPLSPLEIPELLQLIFSFVGRYTLAKTVALVCRQWLFLNQEHLYREVTWDVNWKPSHPERALERLIGASRLVLSCPQCTSKWNGPDLHSALLALQNPPQRSILSRLLQRGKPVTTDVIGFDRPLHEMVLVTEYNFADERKNLLPFPPSLRSLTVDNSTCCALDVGRILAICPLLESLHLFTTVAMTLQGPWTSRGKDALPDRLPLRSLIVRRLDVSQSWMEDLLTITPDLEDLKLIGIKQGVDGNHWDWLRFSKHLRSLSLPLRQIHYSIAFQTQTDAELDDMVVGICPNATKRTLMLHYLTPTVVKGLMDLPFNLTTLDILLPDYPHCSIDSWLLDYRDAGSKYTARPLHQLLCESSNLRHLRTLRMAYTTDLMDVHNRGDMFVPLSSSSMVSSGQLTLLPNQPGIWVCRDLETLALDLHYHRVGTIDGPHYTRIVYGYVSRVCPRLQDLQIKFPRSCTWIDGDGYGSTITDCRPFDLERGLCLLSRLKCLERLKVENSVECSVSELNWLCRSGETAEHRAQRRAIVDEWTARLKEEATLEVVRLWTNNTIANDILGSGTDDPELMAGLKNLGLLQDVKEMVEEMDSDDFVCLPELRQLACGSHLEQTPEKELRSLFYVQPPPKQPTLFSRLKRLSRN